MKKTACAFILSCLCFGMFGEKWTVDNNSVEIEPVNAVIPEDFMRGFDASACCDSYLKDKYKNVKGNSEDIFGILKSAGVNWVRFRIWNNPFSSDNPSMPGNSSLETVVEQCKAAKAKGLKILLDFHYSDYWTDPGKQTIPHEWLKNKTQQEMADSLYDWTKTVLETLKKSGISPEMIQVGNEINSGILNGYYSKAKNDYDIKKVSEKISGAFMPATKKNFIAYLASGIKACREICPSAMIMLHIAGGGTDQSVYFDLFKENNLDYDIIGLSYYPFEKSHGKIEDLGKYIVQYKEKYGKKVVVVETAHPWKTDNVKSDDLKNAAKNLTYKNGKVYNGVEVEKGYAAASMQNQANVIRAVIEVTAANGGSGVFEWGGEYIGSWKYGIFSDNGKPLPELFVFSVKGK